MLNGNSMYFYVFWELIYFYVICIYVIWETTKSTIQEAGELQIVEYSER